MQFERIIFLCAFILCTQGQSTLVPNYSCDQDNDTVGFTLSASTHSGWEPTSNCLLSQCLLNSNNNNSCRSSTTPCFDYRTINNTRFCAPGILCSILEPCNTTTYTCQSNALVCVINSCCSPSAICIPSIWTDFCELSTATTTSTETTSTTSTTTTSSSTRTSSSTTKTSTSTSSTTTSKSRTTTSTSTTTSKKTTTTSRTTSTTTSVTTVATTTGYNCFGPNPTSLTTLSGNTNTTWLSYAYNYTATKTAPILVFGFDGSMSMYIALDDVSVVDIFFPAIQLLNNPSFENSTASPTGWTQWCTYTCDPGTAGSVSTTGCRTGKCFISNCATGGTDFLGQGFTAIIGRIYRISFWTRRVRFLAINNNVVELYAGIV